MIPRPPCRSVCEKFNQKCATVLEQHGIPPQDCSQLPDSYLEIDFGNYQGASVHCTENKQPISGACLSLTLTYGSLNARLEVDDHRDRSQSLVLSITMTDDDDDDLIGLFG